MVIERLSASASASSAGKKSPMGWSTPARCPRSMAMPTSIEISVFDADFRLAWPRPDAPWK